KAQEIAAQQSRDLGNATLSNDLLAHMNDPAFAATLKNRSTVIDKMYEVTHEHVVSQQADFAHKQQVTWWVLFGSLTTFVVFVSLFSIVTTNKFAGPAYRIRRMMQELAEGKVRAPKGTLREGDELTELFDAVHAMQENLYQHEVHMLTEVDKAIEQA